MKTIVVSGINLFEGGTLTVMKNCLHVLSKYYDYNYKVYALVHSNKLFANSDFDNIEFIEFPKSRKSYFYRLYYEYIYFRKLSKRLNPYIWISLHDLTPNVIASKRYVYCHNATPFFKPKMNDWLYGRNAALSSLFYAFFYRINIKMNDGVIVQQRWMGEAFKKMFKIDNVIVAYPNTDGDNKLLKYSSNYGVSEKFEFIYPAFPRSFKNFEIICEAVKNLPELVKNKICVYLTIDQHINKYSKHIYNTYSKEKALVFLGIIPYQEVLNYYNRCDFLLFPSKLETWGLPISEFKLTGKPIILSDLPYAHEALNDYERAAFFDPDNSSELRDIIVDIVSKKQTFKSHTFESDDSVFKDWKSLINHLVK